MQSFRALFLLFAAFLANSAFAATYIQSGRLFDSVSGELLEDVTVVVKGSKIQSIERGFISGSKGEDQVIDLREKTVLPGLFDLHVHLSKEYSKRTYAEKFFLNPADYAFRAVRNAKITLLSGFTSVRDLGDQHRVCISLRKAIKAGLVDGPRVYAAGKSIATTGGHADPTNGITYDIMGSPDPVDGVANGPYEAREAVRQRYKDGSDVIKITATGGVLSLAKSGQNPQFMDDELKAIVETAKDYNLTVAVHAHGDEGMRRAILAGVDTIEHGTLMSDDTMKLMAERGTYFVPTITTGWWVAEKAKEPGFFPAVVRPKAASIGPQIQGTFEKAYRAGVKIAFGTDTGVPAHGENAKEFIYMVNGGMPEAEALQAATLTAAKALKVDDEFGSIEAGKFADIIAVDGNPLEDISLMQDVTFVMKDGKIYK